MNNKLDKRDWAEVSERVSCSHDMLEGLFLLTHLDPAFKGKVKGIQNRLLKLEDKAWRKSRTKKEKKEIGL